MQITTTPKRSIPLPLARVGEAGIVVLIVMLVAGVSLRSPHFLTLESFCDILLSISILAIVVDSAILRRLQQTPMPRRDS